MTESFHIDDSLPTGEILTAFQQHLRERSRTHLGYPYNLEFDHASLAPFLQFLVNNLGDPFEESNYGVHSRAFELSVLSFFAKLWEIDEDEYWGYCTCSGTEGNLYGLLLGREVLPDATLFASRESHYSVLKAAAFYRISVEEIDTLHTGEIDYDALRRALAANRPKTAILNCNLGTTVKGAIDDISKVIEILHSTGYSDEEFYIHCDGALFACILPFLAGSHVPKISFRSTPISTVSVSGHKFLGSPMPCGVVLTRKPLMQRLQRRIDYIGSVDTTIMGSRNGQAPLAMWYQIQKKRGPEGTLDGLREDARSCIENAGYLRDALDRAGLAVMLNPFSNTVVFEKPPQTIVKKWQLATTGNVAHVVVMQNVDREKLDLFIDEVVSAAEEERATLGRKCVREYIGRKHCMCGECLD